VDTSSKKAVIAAVLANSGIAIAKFVGFLLTGAASMLAEAIHSVADAGNQGLLLYGGKRSGRVADDRHPFGYGRERYFWAFVVALVLFSLGSLFAIYEGIEKLRHPHELDSVGIAIGILSVAIVLEAYSFRTAIIEAKKVKRKDESWWRFIRRTKQPELPVVLLEDAGAQFGLVFALAGVVLARVTHEPRWDAVGSIAIGLLLGVIAIFLAVEMKSMLIGEAAEPEVAASVTDAVISGPEVTQIIHLRTLQLGPEDLLIAAKVELGVGAREIPAAINAIEHRIRAKVPMTCLIFVEPDVFVEAGTDA
jgi:cation diffusion facilitator family transporter